MKSGVRLWSRPSLTGCHDQGMGDKAGFTIGHGRDVEKDTCIRVSLYKGISTCQRYIDRQRCRVRHDSLTSNTHPILALPWRHIVLCWVPGDVTEVIKVEGSVRRDADHDEPPG